jgi:hypothetical protein
VKALEPATEVVGGDEVIEVLPELVGLLPVWWTPR